jgi:predicted DNA-binding ribbon-helix-helix protein
MAFWDTLEEIASKEGTSLARFLTNLHDEVLSHHGEANNFASLLRCCCLTYTSSLAGAATPPYPGIDPRLETAE